ncbi:hypothetical protein [Methylobacterium sp. PvR107]|uniref:hypothetical protein n=1 Tax=Methylobacterium sp. PvR107 TaxID=2806597 RepID=UPI001AE226EE|nr:hypothetical protein [Methylobacterium sp. PvR107]MBP1180198.1 hypothetical protein [Methylobacterium sp. PvR107]
MKTRETADFSPNFGRRDHVAANSMWEALNIAVLCLVAMLVLGAAVLSLALHEAWTVLARQRRPPHRVPHATH